ncbi:DUF488 domain-containing protein [Enterococcus timonensis]|uniref:DUF488 domain-containing protein n=1 Tax=Enterococcus timonensis TaxID=1852364 RepID=UPI0008DA37E5|nr:DUF488 domain-containing protein [Enterococcus timonensis]
MLKIKRIYQAAQHGDGYRILVDRLWPRGKSKEEAQLDLWLKEIGPTTDLRKWFNHDVEKFPEFEKKYQGELSANPALKQLKEIVKKEPVVTLLFAAKDEAHNNAVVLQHILQEKK